MVCYVCDFIGMQPQIQCVQYAARYGDAKIGLHVFRLIPQERGYAVSVLQAKAGERVCQAARAPVKVSPCGSRQPPVRQAGDDLHAAEYSARAFEQRRHGQRKIHHQSTHRPRFSDLSPVKDAASYHHISRISRGTYDPPSMDCHHIYKVVILESFC